MAWRREPSYALSKLFQGSGTQTDVGQTPIGNFEIVDQRGRARRKQSDDRLPGTQRTAGSNYTDEAAAKPIHGMSRGVQQSRTSPLVGLGGGQEDGE
jgi:hypothetical protein